MVNADIIDSLIATYRNLNLAIRPMPEAQATKAAGGQSLRDLIIDLRDNEMMVSQQLKLMTLGEGGLTGTMPDILPIAENLSTRSILSEFGTAREAILALIRELPEDDWAAEREGPNGRTSIQTFIEQLVAHDREALSKIEPLVKSPAV